MSISLQYAIVFLILLLVAIWVIVSLIRQRKTPDTHCPGCTQTNCPTKALTKKPDSASPDSSRPCPASPDPAKSR
ncbi:MAG: FeoB-associated Cys-rich membrane protein [Lepagella sp.]